MVSSLSLSLSFFLSLSLSFFLSLSLSLSNVWSFASAYLINKLDDINFFAPTSSSTSSRLSESSQLQHFNANADGPYELYWCKNKFANFNHNHCIDLSFKDIWLHCYVSKPDYS